MKGLEGSHYHKPPFNLGLFSPEPIEGLGHSMGDLGQGLGSAGGTVPMQKAISTPKSTLALVGAKITT